MVPLVAALSLAGAIMALALLLRDVSGWLATRRGGKSRTD